MYWGDNSVNCFRNCSNAGVCKSGWCHCDSGRWGIDCSRTKVRVACDAQHNATPRRRANWHCCDNAASLVCCTLPVTCVLALQAYARHEKTPRRSLRIYVQELPVTLNLAYPVVFRDGRFLHSARFSTRHVSLEIAA